MTITFGYVLNVNGLPLKLNGSSAIRLITKRAESLVTYAMEKNRLGKAKTGKQSHINEQSVLLGSFVCYVLLVDAADVIKTWAPCFNVQTGVQFILACRP